MFTFLCPSSVSRVPKYAKTLGTLETRLPLFLGKTTLKGRCSMRPSPIFHVDKYFEGGVQLYSQNCTISSIPTYCHWRQSNHICALACLSLTIDIDNFLVTTCPNHAYEWMQLFAYNWKLRACVWELLDVHTYNWRFFSAHIFDFLLTIVIFYLQYESADHLISFKERVFHVPLVWFVQGLCRHGKSFWGAIFWSSDFGISEAGAKKRAERRSPGPPKAKPWSANRELGIFSLQNSSVSVHNVHFIVYAPLIKGRYCIIPVSGGHHKTLGNGCGNGWECQEGRIGLAFFRRLFNCPGLPLFLPHGKPDTLAFLERTPTQKWFTHFWTVAKGSSISWVAKFEGDKFRTRAVKRAVAKLQGDKTASLCRKMSGREVTGWQISVPIFQWTMELYDPWIAGPLRVSWIYWYVGPPPTPRVAAMKKTLFGALWKMSRIFREMFCCHFPGNRGRKSAKEKLRQNFAAFSPIPCKTFARTSLWGIAGTRIWMLKDAPDTLTLRTQSSATERKEKPQNPKKGQKYHPDIRNPPAARVGIAS